MNYPKNRYTGEHPWMNKDWLYNEYIIKDKASIEIAREWNCSQNTIQCWLLKYNIKKPITKHISGIINKIISEHNELDINKIEDKLKIFDLIINDKTFNNLDNIITLCLDCHKQVHYNK